jgi:hypothetical protein
MAVLATGDATGAREQEALTTALHNDPERNGLPRCVFLTERVLVLTLCATFECAPNARLIKAIS